MASTNAFALLHRRTDDITLCTYDPLFSEAKQLSRFCYRGFYEYVRKSEIATTSNKAAKKASIVWQFSEELVRIKDDAEVFWCYECEVHKKVQPLNVCDGTSNARSHLINIHKIDMATGKKKEVSKKPLVRVLVYRKDLDVFKRLLVRWFAFCQLALFMLEKAYFRELITFLNETIGKVLPKASATLRRWIMEEFQSQKKMVAAQLSESISKVHLSFDIWTAGNWIGFISIYGYRIDVSGCRHRQLLAFRRIYSSHSGENQAEIVLEVINEYGIKAKIGYIVSDNASSNTSAVKYLFKQLDPSLDDDAITSRRLRCLSHVINLAAQALLASSDPEAGESPEMDADEGSEAYDRSVRAWIHSGPLVKLQRLIKYVLSSGLRREEFDKLKGGKKVVEFDHLRVSRSSYT